MCIDTDWAFSLLLVSSTSTLYPLVSSFLPPKKAEAKQKLRVSRNFRSVFVVSQDTVSCGLGMGGVGSPSVVLWETEKNAAWWGLALAFKASAGCFQDAFCSAGMIFCHLSKTKPTHVMLWCDWKMEKFEGIQHLMESNGSIFLSSLAFIK